MNELSNNFHASFKLNGISYNSEELQEVAYSLIKEGLEYEIDIGDFLLDWLSDSAIINAKSSGSTGQPKTIALQKQYMVNSARATGQFLGLKPGNTALLCLPMQYIAGQMMMVRALVLGLELYCIHPVSSPLRNTTKKYDFCAMVPMQLKNAVDDIERIEKVLVGGAPVSGLVKNMIRNKGNMIYETFGMTETISHIAMRKLSGLGEASCFQVLDNISIAVDDRSCLVVKAPELGVDEITTNDVVELLSETEFNWLGRIDNVVNSGGVKLYPEIIEEKLEVAINQRFFVTGLADEILGEKLVLILEGTANKDRLMKNISSLENLQRFEVPKAVYSTLKFEETSSGKINRRATMNELKI